MKIRQLEKFVKEVLIEVPESRDDDYILIAEVCNRIQPAVGHLQFNVCMLGHKEMGLPSFESITRCRRKLQAEYEELHSSKYLQKLRKEQEEEIRKYVNN